MPKLNTPMLSLRRLGLLGLAFPLLYPGMMPVASAQQSAGGYLAQHGPIHEAAIECNAICNAHFRNEKYGAQPGESSAAYANRARALRDLHTQCAVSTKLAMFIPQRAYRLGSKGVPYQRELLGVIERVSKRLEAARKTYRAGYSAEWLAAEAQSCSATVVDYVKQHPDFFN